MAAGVSILWQRLDRPGHDACALRFEAGEWHLEGAAVWRDPAGPAHLGYSVTCGDDWHARSARVLGQVGGRGVSLSIRRGTDGAWRLNGAEVPGSHGLTDLDLGFTPATNTLALNRLKLTGGGDSAAVWLDDADWQVGALHQRYRREADGRWHYGVAATDFSTLLTVNRHGLVTDYPGYWTQED